MQNSLNDLEKFIHDESHMPLLQIGIIHAQFETIHPFLDGNGRTGRMIISLFLYARGMLEKPVLYLSSYFLRHKKTYYARLDAYHNGDVKAWIDFFLDGVIEIANESIGTSLAIDSLYREEMSKIQSLGKREATSGVKLLIHLFREPSVTSATVAKALGFRRE
jgi:Fic family protein